GKDEAARNRAERDEPHLDPVYVRAIDRHAAWRRSGAVILFIIASSLGDQFVVAVRQTFKIEPERFVFRARVSEADLRSWRSVKLDVRLPIEISRAGDDATDRMPALAAIADVNVNRLFAGAHLDLRRGLARRRWVIRRRI